MKHLAVILIIALVLFFVVTLAFPYANLGEQDRTQLYINLVLIVLFGSSLVVQFSGNLKGAVGRAFVWVVVFLGLVVVYSFKDQFVDLKNRLTAQFFPNEATVTPEGTVSFRKSDDGHFHIKAMVNGAPVIFLLDTGASNIVLSPQDAERIGFSMGSLRFNQVFYTANGVGRGASVKLHALQVGTIHMTEIPASVNQAPMDSSLLGMRFLEKLHSYKVQGDMLILVP